MSRSPFTNPPYGFFAVQDLVELDVPPREPLLAPWLLTGSINMIYAKAGVGKSNFALGMAIAMLKGEPFLGFTPTRKARTLYVDGEMPVQELIRRTKALNNGQPYDEGLYFSSVSQAEPDFRLPLLNTTDGQDMVMRMVDDVAPDVLILDNKSTLFSNKNENDSGEWDGPQRWLIRLRAAGLAVVLIHHAGKSGSQRGSSAHEVAPDVGIELYEPEGPKPTTGSAFVLHFEKQRHFCGDAANPKLVNLVMREDSASWSWEPYKGGRKLDPRREQAIMLRQQGLSHHEIAKQVGASASSVHAWTKTDTPIA